MSTGLEPKICVTKMQSFLKRLNSREILALNLLIHSKRELNISYYFLSEQFRRVSYRYQYANVLVRFRLRDCLARKTPIISN